jgi:hypothetical protein
MCCLMIHQSHMVARKQGPPSCQANAERQTAKQCIPRQRKNSTHREIKGGTDNSAGSCTQTGTPLCCCFTNPPPWNNAETGARNHANLTAAQDNCFTSGMQLQRPHLQTHLLPTARSPQHQSCMVNTIQRKSAQHRATPHTFET